LKAGVADNKTDLDRYKTVHCINPTSRVARVYV